MAHGLYARRDTYSIGLLFSFSSITNGFVSFYGNGVLIFCSAHIPCRNSRDDVTAELSESGWPRPSFTIVKAPYGISLLVEDTGDG